MLTPTQLETIVILAVDRARAQLPPEDDRVELKSEWPKKSDARQLAGAANRANGEALIYVIGVNGHTGALVNPGPIDSAAWWQQMRSQFHLQAAPDLVINRNVAVGDQESVTALLFQTDAAPYMYVDRQDVLEVPIRENTSTRSARRDELLRLLAPSVALPTATMLTARGGGQFTRQAPRPEDAAPRPESCTLHFQFSIYLEMSPGLSVALPKHRMLAGLDHPDLGFTSKINLRGPLKDEPPPPVYGVATRTDGVYLTGPGQFHGSFGHSYPADAEEDLAALDSLSVRIELNATGALRPVLIKSLLKRAGPPDPKIGPDDYHRGFGHWVFDSEDDAS